MAELLFIYGSLLDHSVQKKVFGRIDEGVDAVLEKHKRIPIFIEGQKYANVIPDKHLHVDGKIITVTETELKKIDLFEEPEFYRENIVLKNGEKTWVYIFKKNKSEGEWI